MAQRIRGGVRQRGKIEHRSVVIVIVVLVGLGAGLACQGPVAVSQATKRVTAVLSGLQTGGSGLSHDLSTPACQWYKGTSLIADRKVQQYAVQAFATWRGQRQIPERISSYAVIGGEVEAGTDPPAVIVAVTIDGKPLVLRVIEGQPITWVEQ